MQSTSKIEFLILTNLIFNEEYSRKVLPYLKDAYFTGDSSVTIFNIVSNFIKKYDKLPTVDAIEISLQDMKLSESTYQDVFKVVKKLQKPDQLDCTWLIDETEKFCRDRAVYNAIFQSINIIDGKDKTYNSDAIPSLLSQALSIQFDQTVGHDYFVDVEKRFEIFNNVEIRIPFDIELLNTITNNGLPPKTLNILLAGTGVGKTLCMCHFAAATIAQGKNVLYITLEIAEERIAERIDANLLNIPIDDLANLTKQMFQDRVEAVHKKTRGRCIVKEYPTTSAHAGHFDSLLQELKTKKNFTPDIIFVDYLNICASMRYKAGSHNSYTVVKGIAEELRALAQTYNVPVFSATQTTRTGYSNTDVEITDTSESFGLPQTADFMIALISTEQLEQLGQVMVKQLKNRYTKKLSAKRFMIGIDYTKMRLYDLEGSAQSNLTDAGDTPLFEETTEDDFWSKLNSKKVSSSKMKFA